MKRGDLVALVTNRRVRGIVTSVFADQDLVMVSWRSTTVNTYPMMPVSDLVVLV